MTGRYSDAGSSDFGQRLVAADRIGAVWLIAAGALTVVFWHFPGGNYILYPFTILATWFHEMAHGLAALILGGHFTKLLVFADGSGVAYFTGPLYLDPIGSALVAAAGPMGPPMVGGALILASRSVRAASLSLKVLGAFLLISVALWVRSLFGIVMIPAIGLLILVVSMKASGRVQAFVVQFLGVQACVSTYRQLDYLFTYSAGPLGISDTGRMQQILLLPYWFWGALMAAASMVIMGLSLWRAYRS